MRRLAFLAISFLAVAGCKTDNPESCELEMNKHSGLCVDAGPGSIGCKVDNDCTGNAAGLICDTAKGDGTCVQCTATEHSACVGLTPRCEADVCVSCVDDSDCGSSGVCLPTGECADPAKIIHASASGSNDSQNCGPSDKACDLDTAISIASSNQNVIKLDNAGPYKSTANNYTIDSNPAFNIILDAHGATIHRNGNGAIITINSNKAITILGGTIEGAAAGGGDGIRCNSNSTLTIHDAILQTNNESGIDATGCTLTITHTTIINNGQGGGGSPGVQSTGGLLTASRSTISSNRGGGIIVAGNGKFVIVGNVFLSNGDPAGINGGVTVATNLQGNRLDFNSFSDNKATNTVGGAVQCTVAGGFTAQNNIIWNNVPSATQVAGNCMHAYSDIGPTGVAAANDGGNNMATDPLFNSATDLGVMASSPVHAKSLATADLTGVAARDIVGTMRIAPADLGAYVVPHQ